MYVKHTSCFREIQRTLAEVLFGSYSSRYIARMKELVKLNNIMQAVSLYVAWLRFYMQFKFKLKREFLIVKNPLKI